MSEEMIGAARAQARELRLAQARVTVVESVYHFLPKRQPQGSEVRYSRTLASAEQIYVRLMQIGPEWAKLDCGWVKAASMLVLSNEEGKGLDRVPTPAQRAETAARVVELATTTPEGALVSTDLVPPGESLRRIPSELGWIWVRCRTGTALVTLTLVPA